MAKLKEGRVCDDCGSTEKYAASGRCRPCSLVKNWGRKVVNEPVSSITPKQRQESIRLGNQLLSMRWTA